MTKCRCLHSVDTRRRWLAAGVGWPALAWMGALRAQANPPVVIGWLYANSPTGGDRLLDAFNEGMAALGWRIGAQYLLEERYADGRVERLPALAQELAAKKPAVIVALTSSSGRAAALAAPTTPVVMANGDPLASGLVKSLARPGGMITGVSTVSGDLNQKVLELLVEAMPKLRRVGFLGDSTIASNSASVTNVRRAAEQLRVEAVIADMARPEDIEPAMARLAKDKVQALAILPSAWFSSYMPKIMQLALAQRWPVVGTSALVPGREGGLFGFGPDRNALARRSAYYVDRILKGAKPGDLAIEQPTVFELVLNMKTAKSLGIVIPPSMLVRATKVLE
jgi:putative tryptophan/tyrosine transport system substrate-binding protein